MDRVAPLMGGKMRKPLMMGIAALLLGFGGCAKSSAPAKAPDDAGVDPVTGGDEQSPDAAEQAFASSERELQALLLAKSDEAEGRDDDAAGTATAEPPPPGVSQRARSSRRQRCTRVCGALASMERSARQLCELTGDDDPRCQGVSTRVKAARKLVEEGCPACAP
jgi:hypothetical protein